MGSIKVTSKPGVEFVAVDMPQANRFVVHILAAVAEQEAEAGVFEQLDGNSG